LQNVQEVHDHCVAWEAKRNDYAYEIDGMVIKLDELALQERTGSTNHHPRWAIAYKFKAKQGTSTLESVNYQLGKVGSITPVAKITPVPIGGVTVSSISLHNEDFIKEKDIRLGDTVVVERAGDVIPYISHVLKDIRSGKEEVIQFPTNCPSCNTTLVRQETEAAWRCPNLTGCEEQHKQRVIFHVSKTAMDIDGLGSSLVEKFFQLGFVKDISDIYDLPFSKIEALEGFGKRSSANLQKSIEKAKQNPIHRLLSSLSIHHFGKKASKLIAQTIDHVFDLETKTVEDFVEIKDIGPVLANNLVAYFSVASKPSLA
jgi:NAD-dependent DNA ligase (contains BRCT domain type II)